ncbi:MAG TPA: hypothetical protein VHH92_07255 [Actinomycetota bacterium]|nr:hypothetical protein [Actinomycetota bacterium]
MRRWTPVALALVALLAVGAPAGAAKKTKLKAKPWTFDPGATGIVSSKWVTHQGLGDAGKSDHALVLQKNGTTATVASAGAAVSKVKNLVLTELGFDVEDGTHCGAGGPRYNVTLTDASVFFFGCSHGDMAPFGADSQGDPWTRVRFTDADAVHAEGPTTTWPGFGVAQVEAVHVVFDEGTDTVGLPAGTTAGLVRLDNLDVNGKLMGKPGNSKN